VGCSRLGPRAGSGLPGRLIQRSQQPKPAGETDLLRLLTGTSVSTGDYRHPARGRINPVHLYPDLHQAIVRAPGAGDIGQLADVFTPRRIDAGNCKARAPRAWTEPTTRAGSSQAPDANPAG
jgi:hypothetical protein